MLTITMAEDLSKNLNYKEVTITANGKEFQEGLYAEIMLNANEAILCACMYRGEYLWLKL